MAVTFLLVFESYLKHFHKSNSHFLSEAFPMRMIPAAEPRLQLFYYCYCDFIAGVAACLSLSELYSSELYSKRALILEHVSRTKPYVTALTQPLVRASVDARAGFWFFSFSGSLSKES